MVHQGFNAAHHHSSKAEQRPNKAEESSRLRSFRRDLIRAFLFLASNLFRLIAPALALPTPTVTTTALSTNAAPSATSSAGADRDSSFQVFADGTQDIAALVGIFATDSVEKYAIDYSKGYLATAVANLSLLGLLGYARLLVKLALGAEGCRRAGFDMKALRPMFGVQDEDHVPTDAVHEVYYMRREISERQVHWSVEKTAKHTEESFYLLKTNPLWKPKDLEIVRVWLTGPTYVLVVPLLSILCSALTCFPIMIFERPQNDHQSWTYYYATVGLFCSIVMSTMTWVWVHIQEQHPRGSHYTPINMQMPFQISSPDLKNTFAFSRVGEGFYIYDVGAVERKFRFALKISSFILSGSILIGYACQYIEVRRLSAIKSGYWLLIQGALAVIRVVVWVWDPSWNDFRAAHEPMLVSYRRLWNYDLTETRLVMLWASLRTENASLLRYSSPSESGQLSIPNWVLPAFSPRDQNPNQMFELARKLSRDTIEWDESLQILQNAEDFWDMPPGLFMAWVFAWPNLDSSWVNSPTKVFSCRIIKNKQYENGEQRLHFLPCQTHGLPFPILHEDGTKDYFVFRIFGVPYNRNRCVSAMEEHLDVHTNSARPRQHKLVIGCDTTILGRVSRTLADCIEEPGFETMEEIFDTMDMMWRSLDPILKTNQYRPLFPSSPASPTELHNPTGSIRASQRASPANSPIELDTLP